MCVSDLLAALGGDAVGDAHGRDAPRLRADDVDLHECEAVSKCAEDVSKCIEEVSRCVQHV